MSEVFISYKNERRDFVRRVAALIEANGFETFWDHELVAGPAYTTQLEDKLRQSQCVLVLWCTGSRASPYVIDEARRARSYNKMLPAIIERVDPPLGFGTDQLIDLTHWRGAVDDANFEKVIESIERHTGRIRRRWTNILHQLALAPAMPPLEPLTPPAPEPAPRTQPPVLPTFTQAPPTATTATAPQTSPSAASATDILARISAGDQDMPIQNTNLREIAEIISALGYRAEVMTPDGASPYIKFKLSGITVIAYGFPKDQPSIRSIQFASIFTQPSGNAKANCDKFNEGTRFAKAYIDKDGDLMLELDFFLNGISKENFEAYMDIFDASLSRLRALFAE